MFTILSNELTAGKDSVVFIFKTYFLTLKLTY